MREIFSYIPEAIENAKINAKRMGVTNAEFICGDAGTAATELEKRGTKLYSLAPLPFLLSLFAMEASATEIPSAAVLEGIPYGK